MTTSQQRKLVVEDEDASTLNLGAEFTRANCLFISEVYYFLKRQQERKQARQDGMVDEGAGVNGITSDTNPVFERTLAYCEKFNPFRSENASKEVRRVLAERMELQPFELSQLANLVCDSSDEAKALIPSLQDRIDDDDLQSVLEDIKTIKRFGN